MTSLDDRIGSHDVTLFEAIHSETTENDRRSLLVLQDCIRREGEYSYLEIGSHLGGTIQPHYVDSRCSMIFSIDKRPEFMPDERGRLIHYAGNTSEGMMRGLARAFPSISNDKIRTFDCDASMVPLDQVVNKPRICFIDGEHTDQAVFSDFRFCLSVSSPDALIALHDANLIFGGIKRIENFLSAEGARFQSLLLRDVVFVILMNQAINFAERLIPFSRDREEYFRKSEEKLSKRRRDIKHSKVMMLKGWLAKYPPLYNFVRTVKRRALRQNCPIEKNCCLPRGHHGQCQPRS